MGLGEIPLIEVKQLKTVVLEEAMEFCLCINSIWGKTWKKYDYVGKIYY